MDDDDLEQGYHVWIDATCIAGPFTHEKDAWDSLLPENREKWTWMLFSVFLPMRSLYVLKQINSKTNIETSTISSTKINTICSIDMYDRNVVVRVGGTRGSVVAD